MNYLQVDFMNFPELKRILNKLSFEHADKLGRLSFDQFEKQWPNLNSKNFNTGDLRMIFLILKDDNESITQNDINFFINEMELRALDPLIEEVEFVTATNQNRLVESQTFDNGEPDSVLKDSAIYLSHQSVNIPRGINNFTDEKNGVTRSQANTVNVNLSQKLIFHSDKKNSSLLSHRSHEFFTSNIDSEGNNVALQEIQLSEKIGHVLVNYLDELRSSKKIKDTHCQDKMSQMLKLLKNFQALMFKLNEKVSDIQNYTKKNQEIIQTLEREKKLVDDELCSLKIIYDRLNEELDDQIELSAELKVINKSLEKKLVEASKFDMQLTELSYKVNELEGDNSKMHNENYSLRNQITSYQKEIQSFNSIFENDKFMKDFMLFDDLGKSNAYDPNEETRSPNRGSMVQDRFNILTTTMEDIRGENKNLARYNEELKNKLSFDSSTILKLKREIE